jgi:hypothetical protein
MQNPNYNKGVFYMNKISKMMIKLLVVTQILALTLLTACATVGNALGTTTSTNVCHATGDLANPYEEVMLDSTELVNEHLAHPNDIFPVPAGGCPTSQMTINDGKITICHATGSETNPYNEITVSINGLNGHGTHKGDVFPSAEGGCPATNPLVPSLNNDKITICHATGSKKNPYTEITVSVNGLNGHEQHEGDIIPMPASGCPTTK